MSEVNFQVKKGLTVPRGTDSTPSIIFDAGDTDTGVYSPGANQLAVSTSGTKRVEFGTSEVVFNNGGENYDFRIEGVTKSNLLFVNASTNRIGVGTLAPFAELDVVGITQTSNKFIGDKLVSYTTASGSAVQLIPRNAGGNEVVVLHAEVTGNVGIGTTGPNYQLELSTDSAGKPSTNTWTIVSDERIKEDIELADLDICYDAIKNIPLKRFKWKDEVYTEEQVPDRHKLGWIAQDVESVFPKAVHIHEFKYNQIFEETVIPAVEEELDEDGNVITPAQPERIEKGELISEDVIEDCRDLNADQIYAAMYGAIQKLIVKVETLEAEL